MPANRKPFIGSQAMVGKCQNIRKYEKVYLRKEMPLYIKLNGVKNVSLAWLTQASSFYVTRAPIYTA